MQIVRHCGLIYVENIIPLRRKTVKKRTKWIIAAAIVLLAVIAIVILSKPAHYGKVVVIDGLEYGMTPKEVEEVLGAPYDVIDPNSNLSDKEGATYIYRLELEGHTADVTLMFVKIAMHQELCSVIVGMSNLEENEAEFIAESIRNSLISEYENCEGYYCEDEEIGLNHGAIGLYCKVRNEHERVFFDGYCNDYEEYFAHIFD